MRGRRWGGLWREGCKAPTGSSACWSRASKDPSLGMQRPLAVPSWPQGEEEPLLECALSGGLLPVPLQCAPRGLPGARSPQWGEGGSGVSPRSGLPRMWASGEIGAGMGPLWVLGAVFGRRSGFKFTHAISDASRQLALFSLAGFFFFWGSGPCEVCGHVTGRLWPLCLVPASLKASVGRVCCSRRPWGPQRSGGLRLCQSLRRVWPLWVPVGSAATLPFSPFVGPLSPT